MTKPLFYLAGGLLMALSVAFVVHSTLMPDQLLGANPIDVAVLWTKLCVGNYYFFWSACHT